MSVARGARRAPLFVTTFKSRSLVTLPVVRPSESRPRPSSGSFGDSDSESDPWPGSGSECIINLITCHSIPPSLGPFVGTLLGS